MIWLIILTLSGGYPHFQFEPMVLQSADDCITVARVINENTEWLAACYGSTRKNEPGFDQGRGDTGE